jgi:hypothetical protein
MNFFDDFLKMYGIDDAFPPLDHCAKCKAHVLSPGGLCESCNLDELNKQLGAIVQEVYGSAKNSFDDMAMYAMGIPDDYNPYRCYN